MVSPEIIWCNGPYKGSVHDLTIARDSLVQQLNEEEALLGDKAYIGEQCFITPFKPAQGQFEREFNILLYRYRQNIERIIKRMKIFRCIKEEWRHDISLHYLVFIVIANITNLNLLEKPLNK